MIIGIAGFICSGKEEAVKHIVNKFNFSKSGFGDEVRIEANARGIFPSRVNLQQLGKKLSEEFGYSYWPKRLLSRLNGNYVVDGLRYPQQVEVFRKEKNFVFIAITAPDSIRKERFLKRGKDDDKKIDFEIADMNDRFNIQKTEECMGMADFVIANDGSLEEFHQKLDKVLKKVLV